MGLVPAIEQNCIENRLGAGEFLEFKEKAKNLTKMKTTVTMGVTTTYHIYEPRTLKTLTRIYYPHGHPILFTSSITTVHASTR